MIFRMLSAIFLNDYNIVEDFLGLLYYSMDQNGSNCVMLKMFTSHQTQSKLSQARILVLSTTN